MEKKTLCIAIADTAENTPNYIKAFQTLGAETENVDGSCDADAFDGLLLPGGGDVDPSYFNEENCGSTDIDRELDEMQFALLKRFVSAGKPVLGICRGHQVINVAFGGSLVQDLPTAPRHKRVNNIDNAHVIQVKEDSWLARLYGTSFAVNSSHHQGVCREGGDIEFIARSEEGVIEALAHKKYPVWGVQFHPERMCFDKRRSDTVDGSLVLRFFLEQCADK